MIETLTTAIAKELKRQSKDAIVEVHDVEAAELNGEFNLEELAIAVLEALREPSDEMLTAAGGLTEGEGGPADIWQAMIDAALVDE